MGSAEVTVVLSNLMITTESVNVHQALKIGAWDLGAKLAFAVILMNQLFNLLFNALKN